ncbi:hypothetical protein COEX109129_42050 [Corallococcus exiguus]
MAGSGGGTSLSGRKKNAPSSTASGTSFSTVSAVQVRADTRMPDATSAARPVTSAEASSRSPMGPPRPTDGATARARPAITADVLRKALT